MAFEIKKEACAYFFSQSSSNYNVFFSYHTMDRNLNHAHILTFLYSNKQVIRDNA